MHMVKTILGKEEVAVSLRLLLPLAMAAERVTTGLLHQSLLLTMPASPILRTLVDPLLEEIARALMVSLRSFDRKTIELLRT